MKRIIRRGLVGVSALTLAGLGVASPALAANTPGTGGQSYTGTISLAETISMTLGLSNFALTPADTPAAFPPNAGPASMAPGAGQVVITSNDPTGYFVDEVGPVAFTGAGSNTFPTNDVSASAITLGPVNGHGANMWATLPTPGQSPLVAAASSGPSGTFDLIGQGGGVDSFDLDGWTLNTVSGGAPADTYTGQVSLTLWGNA